MEPIFSPISLTSERRRHERVNVSYTAQVQVIDGDGNKLGVLRQLSRSGFMMEPETEKEFKQGKKYKLTLVDCGEHIRLPVRVVVRHAYIRRTGFEFDGLDIKSAVEIGIMIGKYYPADRVVA